MKISQLRQIVEVLSCGSINKASEKLYISQSGLSAAIQAAEKELGQPVLKRSHSGITPTAFGLQFQEAAQKILEIYDGLLQSAAPPGNNRLRISSQFLRYAGSVFTMICTENASPYTEFRFTEKGTKNVLADVLDQSSDLGIVVTPSISRQGTFAYLESRKLEGHLVRVDQSRCMIGPHHPRYDSAESTIPLAELAYYPRLCYASEDQALSRELFDLEDAYFPRMGLLTISDTGSFHNFLAQTPAYFIGIHTDSAYQATQFYKDIRVLDILGTDFSYDTIWVRRRGWSLTPLARTYLRRLYAVAGSEPDPILT